jgi:hypothetical protein
MADLTMPWRHYKKNDGGSPRNSHQSFRSKMREVDEMCAK